ncbi:hypothetical protein BT69DRAFT_532857 [Atractiella rhizophila]|nr:hypothetical protein BT69DRAFT_532857 [Atractiella rhizophila]
MSSNEWIVVVSGTSASPNFEVRKATSHSTPQILSAANGAPTVVGAGNEGDNVLFWVVDQTKAFSTSGESYIYASSKTAPSGGRIVQHDASKFGAFVAKFKDPSTTTSTSSSAAGGGNTSDAVEVPWTSFGWVKMHSLLQTALTTVLTITAVVLAVVAIQTNGGGGNLSGHQVMGFVILALLLGQICLGYYIHEKFDANRTKRPPRNVTHMFLGITLLILGYTQVYTGLRLYNEKRPNYFQSYIFALFWILVFAPFVFYGISIGLVVAHRRRKDGMSWGMSLFGLGREGGSLPALQKIPSNTQEVANEKAPVPAPQDPFQGYPNEKAGYNFYQQSRPQQVQQQRRSRRFAELLLS